MAISSFPSLERRGIWLAVTKLALFLLLVQPSAWLAVDASKAWKSMKSYSRLPDALDLPNLVRPSLYLMHFMSYFTCVWIWMCWSLFCLYLYAEKHDFGRRSIVLYAAWLTVDLLVFAALLTAVITQLTYLPSTAKGCNHYNGPASVKDMFFREAVARLKKMKKPEGGPKPVEVCTDFAETTYMAIWIMSVCFVLVVLCLTSPKWKTMKVIFRPFRWGYRRIKAFFRMLAGTKAGIIYVHRLLKQWRMRHLHMPEKTTMTDADAIHLTEVYTECSKSCGPGEKKQCWGCASQICETCSFEITPRIPSTMKHLRYCEPRCSECYFNRVRDADLRSQVCRSSHTTSQTQVDRGAWPLRYQPPRRPRSPIKLDVCRVCSACQKLPPEQLCAKRESREAKEIAHLARGQLKCGECKGKFLQSGFASRWWICADCNGECESGLHPTWCGDPR